jgi:hypothetical protein
VSTYEVNLLCRQVALREDFRTSLRTDPAAVLRTFNLTDAERDALLAGQVAALYEMGAHEYLLMGLARFGMFGLTPALYSDRIRQAAVHSAD